MSVTANKLTKDEYFKLEQDSGSRYEFVNGEMIEVEMAKIIHELLIGNLIVLLGVLLKGKRFLVISSGVKIDIESSGNYRYADVSVVPTESVNFESDTLDNAIVLFEVLSKSTAVKDRTEKFEEYQTLKSLKEYVLVSTDKVQVEIYRRTSGKNWDYITLDSKIVTFELTSIGFKATLGEIYENTPL
jgi:Uma2 family endonuclease